MGLGQSLGFLGSLSTMAFVTTNMLVMGMSLTVPQIVRPLRSTRLVLLTLLGNFVLVPLLAYGILRVIPLEQPLQIGLIILSTAAGAPFLPKLVQISRGDIALGVGLTMMLMLATTAYMPIVLPLLLPGVAVSPWDIAQTLIVFMVIPLTIGLGLRHCAPTVANQCRGFLSRTSTLFLLISVVLNVGLSGASIIHLMGTGSILALLLFIIGSLAIGLFLGGPDPSIYKVTGLGTAQRDLAAAIAVSGQNFPGTMAMPFVVVAGIFLLLILLPTARYLDLKMERAV